MTYRTKPLVWEKRTGVPDSYIGSRSYHVCAVYRSCCGSWVFDGNGRQEFSTLEEAKAAAEADWQARIKEALEPVQDWISVKDRLPKTMTHVIAHGAIQSMQYSDLQIVTEAFRVLTGEWVSVLAPGIIMNVTHWQPMPEPPKEEKE